ncbi:MAG: hypothetical protein RLZZ366_102, partial [Pseudomonadota bacterium]
MSIPSNGLTGYITALSCQFWQAVYAAQNHQTNSSRAGTYLWNGVPTNLSLFSIGVSSFGETP